MEMTILRKLLEERGIQPVEAGGMRAPAQNAFCAKICSKIITAQFCIVLLNNEHHDGIGMPNANVNMENGLMLGFNKYVVPFQRESQKLPFNVAGLDTIKYTNANFERLAVEAIDNAIKAGRQEQLPAPPFDDSLRIYLVNRRMLVAPIDSPGTRLSMISAPLRALTS